MFYYGKSCVNVRTKQILFSSNFLERKKEYYDNVSKYNKITKEREGIQKRTATDKELIDNAEYVIQDNLASNVTFGKDGVEEIKKLSTISQLIASKYLGNIKNQLENVPVGIVDGLKGLPQQLVELNDQIKSSILNPAFASYTAPMQKLYKSLTKIGENANV